MSSPFYSVEHFDAAETLPYLLRRAVGGLTALTERLLLREREALSLTQWQVLISLSGGADLTASVLATQMGYDMGSLTRVVDTLVKQTLVSRTRSRTDRRCVRLALTPHGRALTETRLPKIVVQMNSLMEGFTTEEAQTLHVLLKRLIHHVDDRLLAGAAAPSTAPATRFKRGFRKLTGTQS